MVVKVTRWIHKGTIVSTPVNKPTLLSHKNKELCSVNSCLTVLPVYVFIPSPLAAGVMVHSDEEGSLKEGSQLTACTNMRDLHINYCVPLFSASSG